MRSLPFVLLLLFPALLIGQQEFGQALFNPSFTVASGMTSNAVLSEAPSVVLQSTDGGQSWQDISAGLSTGLDLSAFSAADGQLYLSTVMGVYHRSATAKEATWKRETALIQSLSKVSAHEGGAIAFSHDSRFVQQLNGTGSWTPVFKNFKNSLVRNVYTAKDGSIFIGCDDGLYKSSDLGKSWKQVVKHGWVIEIVESDGVLLSTYQGGILRSTDGGENWDKVLSEGGVGIDVAVIDGGFAAINYNSKSKTRRIRSSTDGGKTWQAIDGGLRPSLSISTIHQVGDYLYCGHPEGIYRSADGGKSWELQLPSRDGKVFNLSVVDGVMYAVLQSGGC